MTISFIETLFYLSLVITFVLLLLLVYKFKTSLTNLEQKTAIMHNIINDLVKQQNIMTANGFGNPSCVGGKCSIRDKNTFTANNIILSKFDEAAEDGEDGEDGDAEDGEEMDVEVDEEDDGDDDMDVNILNLIKDINSNGDDEDGDDVDGSGYDDDVDDSDDEVTFIERDIGVTSQRPGKFMDIANQFNRASGKSSHLDEMMSGMNIFSYFQDSSFIGNHGDGGMLQFSGNPMFSNPNHNDFLIQLQFNDNNLMENTFFSNVEKMEEFVMPELEEEPVVLDGPEEPIIVELMDEEPVDVVVDDQPVDVVVEEELVDVVVEEELVDVVVVAEEPAYVVVVAEEPPVTVVKEPLVIAKDEKKSKTGGETYRGLKVEQLRTLVTQHGLDPKNLKKHELIDLLETL
jgi:hypothetical protein